MKSNIKIISASAGSGKTFRLAEILGEELSSKRSRANAVICTTFTRKAAAELKERTRAKLLELGMNREASLLGTALIGTVNGICGEILQRFSFDLGLSPDLEVIDDKAMEIIEKKTLFYLTKTSESQRLSELDISLGLAHYDNYSETTFGNHESKIAEIAKIIRINNMQAEEIKKSCENTIDMIKTLFKAKKGLKKEDFIKTISKVIKLHRTNIEASTLKKDIKFKDAIKPFIGVSDITWNEIDALIDLDVGKSLTVAYKEIREVAVDYLACEEFSAEMQEYVGLIYQLAEKWVEMYQNYKKERKLIDFTDQEYLLLKLLDRPNVIEELKGEIDLLLVDEFQDTSPIQLEIFSRLSKLAKQSYWVGDPKQSIYGFRGADPVLMEGVIDLLSKNDHLEILNTSYRSCKQLVNLNNKFFKVAFKHLPEEQVVLKANRKDIKGTAFLNVHFTDGASSQERYHPALARYVDSYIEREGKSPGDIAILMRTKRECEAVATSLMTLGRKVSFEGGELFSSPETLFLRAVMRLIVEPRNMLSRMEIMLLLEQSPDVESLLKKRLKDPKNPDWGNDHPIITKILELRKNSAFREMSPSESLASLIQNIDMPTLAAGWGREEMAQANIAQIYNQALDFEANANIYGFAPSFYGFMSWLEGETVKRGEALGADCIHVNTYHSAKGLEWDTVFMTNLEKIRDGNPYSILGKTEGKIKADNPLNKRYVHFFPESGLKAYQSKVELSSIQEDANKREQEESRRLFYVGMTRAKNHLIWATRECGDNTLSWPNSMYPDCEKLISEKEEVPVEKDEVILTAKPQKQFYWYPPYEGPRKDFLPLTINPSKKDHMIENLMFKREKIGERISIKGNVEPQELGTAVHNYFCAWIRNPKIDASDFFKRYGFNNKVNSVEIEKCALNLVSWIENKFGKDGLELMPEVSVAAMHKGQILNGQIDLLIKTSDAYVIVDYKTFMGDEEQMEIGASENVSQLTLYKEFIETSLKKKVIGTYLYFSSLGFILKQQQQQQ